MSFFFSFGTPYECEIWIGGCSAIANGFCSDWVSTMHTA